MRCRFAGCFWEAALQGGCAGAARRCPCRHGGAGVGSGDSPRNRPAHAPKTPTAPAAAALKAPSPGADPGDGSSPSRPEVFPSVGRGVRPRGTPLLPLAPRRKGCSRHLLPSASQGISACFFFPAVSYSFSPGKPKSALHSKPPSDRAVRITFRG